MTIANLIPHIINVESVQQIKNNICNFIHAILNSLIQGLAAFYHFAAQIQVKHEDTEVQLTLHKETIKLNPNQFMVNNPDEIDQNQSFYQLVYTHYRNKNSLVLFPSLLNEQLNFENISIHQLEKEFYSKKANKNKKSKKSVNFTELSHFLQ